jgi:hypothetical protein
MFDLLFCHLRLCRYACRRRERDNNSGGGGGTRRSVFAAHCVDLRVRSLSGQEVNGCVSLIPNRRGVVLSREVLEFA